jgi:hypothetical protein
MGRSRAELGGSALDHYSIVITVRYFLFKRRIAVASSGPVLRPLALVDAGRASRFRSASR